MSFKHKDNQPKHKNASKFNGYKLVYVVQILFTAYLLFKDIFDKNTAYSDFLSTDFYFYIFLNFANFFIVFVDNKLLNKGNKLIKAYKIIMLSFVLVSVLSLLFKILYDTGKISIDDSCFWLYFYLPLVSEEELRYVSFFNFTLGAMHCYMFVKASEIISLILSIIHVILKKEEKQ